MSLEHQQVIYCHAPYIYKTGYLINWSQKVAHGDHNWTFDVHMSSFLRITLTYNGNYSSGGEQAVETFGRIYVVDKDLHDAGPNYLIPRTQFNLVDDSFVLEEEDAQDTLSRFVAVKKLRFRLQLYFTKATLAVDLKSLKPYTNLTITVGDTKFYVSKEVLSSVSPVFASSFIEDGKDEIEVEDVTSDEFECLLKVVQPGSRVDIPLAMLPGVLKVAHKYKMESIVSICESRLMSLCDGKMPSDIFSMACEYGLRRAQHQFIKSCSPPVLQKIVQEKKSDSKLSELLKMIMHRLLSDRYAPGIEDWEPALASDLEPKNVHSNLTITVNGTKLYALKGVLASASPVFTTMFFGDFEESKKNEIVIADVDADDFGFLLKLLEPGSRLTVNDKNVMGVLKLADKYLIETVVNICDDFLADQCFMGHALMDKHMYLVVASQYRLRRLQAAFASNCEDDDLGKLFENGLVDSLTPDAMMTVLDGICPLPHTTWKSGGAGSS